MRSIIMMCENSYDTTEKSFKWLYKGLRKMLSKEKYTKSLVDNDIFCIPKLLYVGK